jgi:hypothetical protein
LLDLVTQARIWPAQDRSNRMSFGIDRPEGAGREHPLGNE